MGCRPQRHTVGWSRALPVRRKFWLACLHIALLAMQTLGSQAAVQSSWLPGQYPNPIKYPEACGREDKVGWICDPDNVLAKDQADGVAALLQSISAATPPYPLAECAEQGCDGYPVAVALVKKLGTRFGRPMNVEAAYFADSLYNAWQMEYKNCHIGILLVISVVDRELVGYRKPQKEYSPGRAWGLSLFFCGSAAIAFMVVYRFWLWLGRRPHHRRSI